MAKKKKKKSIINLRKKWDFLSSLSYWYYNSLENSCYHSPFIFCWKSGRWGKLVKSICSNLWFWFSLCQNGNCHLIRNSTKCQLLQPSNPQTTLYLTRGNETHCQHVLYSVLFLLHSEHQNLGLFFTVFSIIQHD